MLTVKYMNPHSERIEEYVMYISAEILVSVMTGLLQTGCIITSITES